MKQVILSKEEDTPTPTATSTSTSTSTSNITHSTSTHTNTSTTATSMQKFTSIIKLYRQDTASMYTLSHLSHEYTYFPSHPPCIVEMTGGSSNWNQDLITRMTNLWTLRQSIRFQVHEPCNLLL